jgi:Reverse transcriptase (RNA-dependent DNA polymerase)
LIAKDYNQESGVDYEETYSPFVQATTIRVILSLATSQNWKINQLDVSNTFLNGTIKEKVYMAQPQRFIDPTHSDFVCLLHKPLYGLKQTSRAWFDKLSTILIQFGFKSSSYDASLFLPHANGHILLVLVYVDDLIVTRSDSVQIQECIACLKSNFAIRDLGTISYFLGIEAQQNEHDLVLTQTKYLFDLLTRNNM